MAGDIKLYTYWRSSACYRVRIALNLKGLAYESIPVHLLKDGGEQHKAGFQEVNPQELIPVLMHGGRMLRQSLAIMEYLDENFDTKRPLMPNVARDRQRCRAISQMIACDIHPLNNLRVQQYLGKEFKATDKQREDWTRHWIEEGFRALETVLTDSLATGTYCEGDSPTMADCCLVPQVYNAQRFGVKLDRYPNIRRINDECVKLPAFINAAPENQPDCPPEEKKK
jgi:maleylacetoacetate isomerase